MHNPGKNMHPWKHMMGVVALLVAGTGHGASLQFQHRGKQVLTEPLSQIEARVKAMDVKVFEPHENKEITYRGFPMRQLLEDVYGKQWSKTEEILFTCTDGYQPSVPASRFLEHEAYLVYAKVDGTPFEVVNVLQNNEKVPLGPFYLVWENIKDAAMRAKGASGWPYQVVAVDLIAFADRFPNMAPPAKSSANVQSGFLHFREQCSQCHRINGEGGEKSIELNYPMSVTEYWKPQYLHQWIDNPASLRDGTVMPRLQVDLADRSKVLSQIVAYLEAMKKKKVAPVTKEKK